MIVVIDITWDGGSPSLWRTLCAQVANALGNRLGAPRFFLRGDWAGESELQESLRQAGWELEPSDGPVIGRAAADEVGRLEQLLQADARGAFTRTVWADLCPPDSDRAVASLFSADDDSLEISVDDDVDIDSLGALEDELAQLAARNDLRLEVNRRYERSGRSG